ncbi:MAG: ABC transporter permease [Chloroflexota bacterium]|nr:ABC transporter permease [Chloroflexota bacterium]MDE2896974.1 ABC transporter permease [Chloroflexota bacterium]
MGSVRIVTRHEFRTAVTRPSYLILTAAVPVLVALAVAGFAIFTLVTREDAEAETASSTESSAQAPRLGYVDLTDGPALFGAHQDQPGAVFVPVSDRDAGVAALMDEQIDALFVFPPDYAKTGRVVRVRIADDGGVFGPDGPSYSGTLRGFVLSNLFADDVPAGLAERLRIPYTLVTEEVRPDGAAEESAGFDIGRAAFFAVAGISLLFSVFFSSGYVLNALVEEKENRVMEVLLSSVKPDALLLGKFFGLGAAGLLQMAAWLGAVGAGVLVLGLIVDVPTDLLTMPGVGDIAIAAGYFLFGYALFASLMAAVGAVTTSLREANQISAIVIVPAFIPVWLNFILFTEPEGKVARVLTFIPVTAPVTGFIRLAIDAMGPLETVAALLVLGASASGALWLAMRLFRAYLLMYGKRPTLKEMARSVVSG